MLYAHYTLHNITLASYLLPAAQCWNAHCTLCYCWLDTHVEFMLHIANLSTCTYGPSSHNCTTFNNTHCTHTASKNCTQYICILHNTRLKLALHITSCARMCINLPQSGFFIFFISNNEGFNCIQYLNSFTLEVGGPTCLWEFLILRKISQPSWIG